MRVCLCWNSFSLCLCVKSETWRRVSTLLHLVSSRSLLRPLCLVFKIILFRECSTTASDINSARCIQATLFLPRSSQHRLDSKFYWASCCTFIERFYWKKKTWSHWCWTVGIGKISAVIQRRRQVNKLGFLSGFLLMSRNNVHLMRQLNEKLL